MRKETFLNKWTKPIEEGFTHKIEDDYYTRFSKEYSVIFEHCLAYINRLIKDTKYAVYLLKTNPLNLALLEEDRFSIFLPELKPLEFDQLYQDAISANLKLLIRDVTKEYLDINNFYLLKKYRFQLTVRSPEEVVLSTHKVSELAGQEYASLRSTVNRIEKSGLLKYTTPSPQDNPNLQELFNRWLVTQGAKYGLDRKTIDLQYLKFFIEKRDERFFSRVVHYKGCLCGIALIEIVRTGFGVYIMNKCLNGILFRGDTYGVSGLSKYLYHRTCKELAEHNIAFINVGSMGTEEGARKSKKELRPIGKYLDSYQINYAGA